MKRIMIDAAKCDGCKSCSIACMQAHRKDEGNVYTLDLTDIANDPATIFTKIQTEAIRRFSADTVTCRSA